MYAPEKWQFFFYINTFCVAKLTLHKFNYKTITINNK